MKFMDELRGSEGERCIVTSLRDGKQHKGWIQSIDENTSKVTVKMPTGQIISCHYSFVTLVEEEK